MNDEKQTVQTRLKSFTGLPITVFVVVFLFALSLLLSTIHGYITQGYIVLVDSQLINFFYTFRNNTLLNFFHFITLFAESTVIIILSVILSIFLWIYKQRIYFFSLWFALIVGEGLTFFGKHFFQRERPDTMFMAITENSFSFPSGHATAVVLLYGFLTYLIIIKYRSIKIRIITFSLFIVFTILVDFSRLYLGVHYLSDVIAGNLVGFCALILSIFITEWLVDYKAKTNFVL